MSKKMTSEQFVEAILSMKVGEVAEIVEHVNENAPEVRTLFTKIKVFEREAIVVLDKEYEEMEIIQDTAIYEASEMIESYYEELEDNGASFSVNFSNGNKL